MRDRYRALELKALARLVPDPDTVFVPHAKSNPIRSPRRYQALVAGHIKRKAEILARRSEYDEVDVAVPAGRKAILFPYEYPSCPKCGCEETIRAGHMRGEQRYRCKNCNATFNGKVKLRVRFESVRLTCHRCGYNKCTLRRVGGRAHSGLKAHCPDCGQTFTQGGRRHLDGTLVILTQRIRELNLPPQIRDELYVQACLDVLEGRGYTFDIELDVKAAMGRANGPWGQGSDHPAISERQRPRLQA